MTYDVPALRARYESGESRNAAEFLRLVRPLLLVKGPQADLAIAALARPHRRGRKLTAAELCERREVHLAMKELNRRGRA